MTSDRQHGDSTVTYKNGPDISLRCRTKKDYERIKRAAKACQLSLNRFVVEAALDRASIVEANRERA